MFASVAQTIRGNQHLQVTDITLTVEGDPEFGLVKEGSLKARGIVKKAIRQRISRRRQRPYSVHELESYDGKYIGWGWWDEALYDREVLVCPIVEYSLKFEGQIDFACLFLLKVNETTFRRCGRARVQGSFFQNCQYIALSTV